MIEHDAAGHKGNKQDGDTIPHGVARERVTRQTKTSRLRWRGRYQDRLIRTGTLENMWISDRPGPLRRFMVLGNDVEQFVSHDVCDLSWDKHTCWHRQWPSARMQFGEAAVPLSCFVERLSKHASVNVRLPMSRSKFSNSETPRCMLIMSCFLDVCLRDHDNTSLFVRRRSSQRLDGDHVTVVVGQLPCLLLDPYSIHNKSMCYGCRHLSCGCHRNENLANLSGAHRARASFSSDSPFCCLPQGVEMLLILQRLAHTRETSCASTYGSLRHVFSSPNVRLNIHVARTAV